MAFDPSTAKPEGTKQGKFDPATATAEPKKDQPTLLQRAAEVGKESLTGGIYGATAPEMMMATGGAIRQTAGRLPGFAGRLGTGVGGALELGGEAMKAARPASTAAGLIGGAGGETAGQLYESKYGPGLGAETVRLLGATLTPVPISYLGTKTGGLIGSIAGKFGFPGMSTAKTIGTLLEQNNIKPQSLTKEQEAFIAKKLEDIRGGQRSSDAELEIINMLKAGAGRITQQAAMTAEQLEAAAVSRPQEIIAEAQKRAQSIRDSARALSPAQRQISEADAQSILQKGQQEATRIERELRQQIADMRGKAGKLTTRAQAGTQEARQALTAVGQPQKPTETGKTIREAVTPVFEKLKATRDTNAQKYKGEAFGEALAKEKAGQRVEGTSAFKDAMATIDSAIKNPETGLANISINEVSSQLQKVKNALDPRKRIDNVVIGDPVSFEGLENLRRFLRDRAYGLPAEGFDAIGQRQAGQLADAVEAIQKEFSPKIGKFLEQYRADSQPLNLFKTKLGQAIVGKEEFDMGRFATDPASLGEQFFKSETGVKDLIAMLGGDARQAEKVARGFVASKLENASGKDIQNFLSTNKDWIDQFPALRQQLETAAKTIGRAEGFGGARTKLAETLRTGATQIADIIPTKTGAVLSEAEKEAQRVADARIKATAKGLKGEKKSAAEIVKEAKDVAKAEGAALTGQAKAVREEAANRAKTILAGTSDVYRVRDIVLGKNKEEWKEMADIVLSTPGGKEKFGDAVGQILGDKAQTSLKGAMNDWKYIGQNLIDNNLMSPQKVAEIEAKLQEIFVTPVDLSQKITFVQTLMRNAVAGYVMPAVTRAID
jgi:hypothetical protein